MKWSFLVVVLCACVDTDDRVPPRHDAPVEQGEAPACPTTELAFTQAEGCLNDGSVEFCLPQGAPDLLASVQAIAPEVACAPGAGRAKCDPATELLCFYPMENACVAHHGALLDTAWAELCAIAALDEVTAIVPTWYE